MDSLEYWRAREEAALELYLRTDEEIQRRIHELYVYLYDELTKQINGFYQRYATAEGITMAEAMERVSKMDVQAFQTKAKKYVEEKDFSKQANEELRLYNATMKINRLELLKAQMGLEMVDTFNDLENLLGDALNDRAIDELRRQAGILGFSVTGNERWAREIVNASFHNATWSQRIWMYQTDLKNELSMLLTNGLIQGQNPRELAPHLARLFGVSQSDALRLMRTEMARVQEDAQKRSYQEADIEQFIFIATEDAKTCEICGVMDGEVFEVKKMMPGENCAPMHPNCRCSTAAYVDRAAVEREVFGEDLYTADLNDLIYGAKEDKIISGAVTGARNPYGAAAMAHAEREYGLIRKMSTDVKRIAKATGYPENVIQQIKNYLFIDEHDLGGGVIKRFDPDYMIAQSGQRLYEGHPEKHDLILLQHEIMERELIAQGLTQDEAHIKASQRYNYQEAAKAFYDQIKKYRKE